MSISFEAFLGPVPGNDFFSFPTEANPSIDLSAEDPEKPNAFLALLMAMNEGVLPLPSVPAPTVPMSGSDEKEGNPAVGSLVGPWGSCTVPADGTSSEPPSSILASGHPSGADAAHGGETPTEAPPLQTSLRYPPADGETPPPGVSSDPPNAATAPPIRNPPPVHRAEHADSPADQEDSIRLPPPDSLPRATHLATDFTDVPDVQKIADREPLGPVQVLHPQSRKPAEPLQELPREGPAAPSPSVVSAHEGPASVIGSTMAVQPGHHSVDQPHESVSAVHESLRADGTAEIRLRLDPPELGTVRIHLIADADGGIHGRILVEDEAVRRLLDGQMGGLRDRLQQAGISLSRFEVAQDHGGGEHRFRHHGPDAWEPFPERPLGTFRRGQEWSRGTGRGTVPTGRLNEWA